MDNLRGNGCLRKKHHPNKAIHRDPLLLPANEINLLPLVQLNNSLVDPFLALLILVRSVSMPFYKVSTIND